MKSVSDNFLSIIKNLEPGQRWFFEQLLLEVTAVPGGWLFTQCTGKGFISTAFVPK